MNKIDEIEVEILCLCTGTELRAEAIYLFMIYIPLSLLFYLHGKFVVLVNLEYTPVYK